MKRIAIAGFSTESNSFASQPASLDRWIESGILFGNQIRSEYESSRATIAGFYGRLREEANVELVPLVFALLMPMGPMTKKATDHIYNLILTQIKENGPWDAVLLSLNGAAVSDEFLDVDGEICKRVRALVGPDVLIGTSLDMHANVSHEIVNSLDVVTICQTTPHLDCYEDGYHCADMVIRQLRGEIKATSFLADPPLLVNILRQRTSDEPMASLLRFAAEEKKRPGVLSVSIGEGSTYADVPKMGMTFLAITDNNPALAKEVANRVASRAWELREELQGVGATAINDALLRAEKAEQFPVVLFDVGDNVGGGSPGDSTFVLHAARKLSIRGVLQALCDPKVVVRCHQLGVGAMITAEVGGKSDSMHGKPFAITGRITAVSDGKYEEPKPSHGGSRFYDDGPSAAIETEDGFKILLTTFPAISSSLEQFRSLGIDPVKEKIVVVKGVHAPRPAYEPIAAELIWLSTPGVSTADRSNFTYTHRRTPLYPFELNTTWRP